MLSSNQLSGTIPDSLGSMSSLRGMYAPTEPLMRANLNRRPAIICRRDMWNNQISGPIPDSLGSLAQLQALCVRDDSGSSISELDIAELKRRPLPAFAETSASISS